MFAVITTGYVPAVPEPGVPESTPPVLNATPLGIAPFAVNVEADEPEAVTLKLPAVPTVKVVVAALVIAGPTDRVSDRDGRAAFEFVELPQLATPWSVSNSEAAVRLIR